MQPPIKFGYSGYTWVHKDGLIMPEERRAYRPWVAALQLEPKLWVIIQGFRTKDLQTEGTTLRDAIEDEFNYKCINQRLTCQALNHAITFWPDTTRILLEAIKGELDHQTKSPQNLKITGNLILNYLEGKTQWLPALQQGLKIAELRMLYHYRAAKDPNKIISPATIQTLRGLIKTGYTPEPATLLILL